MISGSWFSECSARGEQTLDALSAIKSGDEWGVGLVALVTSVAVGVLGGIETVGEAGPPERES